MQLKSIQSQSTNLKKQLANILVVSSNLSTLKKRVTSKHISHENATALKSIVFEVKKVLSSIDLEQIQCEVRTVKTLLNHNVKYNSDFIVQSIKRREDLEHKQDKLIAALN